MKKGEKKRKRGKKKEEGKGRAIFIAKLREHRYVEKRIKLGKEEKDICFWLFY